MSASKIKIRRVLAVDPCSRGFGYVVLESPVTPVDWGVKGVRRQDTEKILAETSKLIRLYMPEAIVVEEYGKTRHSLRVKDLLSKIGDLATKEGINYRSLPASRVKKVFGAFGANTKDQIAGAVAQQVPELAPRVPPRRRAWMSEHYNMAIFDAAALALTYFYVRG